MARPETDERHPGSQEEAVPTDHDGLCAEPLPADPAVPRLVVTVSHDSNNCFIEVAGELDFSTLHLLDEAVVDMCRSGYGATVILGLRQLSFVDCAALGRIVRLHEHLRRTGGRVLLLRPSRRVRRLLELTRLDSTLEVR